MPPFKVAIAGYMGSGKSTCSKIFMDAGAGLIDADLQAKLMMENEPEIIKKLSKEFGNSIIIQDKLSFSRLGLMVFSSIDLLNRLNSIVHPPLISELKKQLLSHKERIVVLDAALIPLWNIEDWFDLRIWVDATNKVRLQRLAKKYPNMEMGQIQQREMMQKSLFPPPSEKTWHYVSNNNSIESLNQKVFSILNQI